MPLPPLKGKYACDGGDNMRQIFDTPPKCLLKKNPWRADFSGWNRKQALLWDNISLGWPLKSSICICSRICAHIWKFGTRGLRWENMQCLSPWVWVSLVWFFLVSSIYLQNNVIVFILVLPSPPSICNKQNYFKWTKIYKLHLSSFALLSIKL